MRKQRIVDKKLIRELQGDDCASCGRSGPSEVHHIRSRGSGGPDEEFNCIAVCRQCHQLIHTVGIVKAMSRFPFLRVALRGRGWSFDGKMFHPRLLELFGVGTCDNE